MSGGATDFDGENNSNTASQTNLAVVYNNVTDSGMSIGVKRAVALNVDGISNGLDNGGYGFSLGGEWSSIHTGV